MRSNLPVSSRPPPCLTSARPIPLPYVSGAFYRSFGSHASLYFGSFNGAGRGCIAGRRRNEANHGPPILPSPKLVHRHAIYGCPDRWNDLPRLVTANPGALLNLRSRCPLFRKRTVKTGGTARKPTNSPFPLPAVAPPFLRRRRAGYMARWPRSELTGFGFGFRKTNASTAKSSG